MSRKRIGELLIEAGVITEQQLAAALAYQQQVGGRIGRILVERKLVPEERLVRQLSAQLGIPVADLPIDAPPPLLLQLIPREVALRVAVFPVGVRKDARGDLLYLAMADPTNVEAIETVRLATGKQVMPFIAGELAIERAIERWLPVVPTAQPAPGPTADVGELPLVTGVLSTPPKGVPAMLPVTATFGRPGSYLGDDRGESDDEMPPPVDLDRLTLAGPALLQPVMAHLVGAVPQQQAPAPDAPTAEAEPPPAQAPADARPLHDVEAEPLELIEAADGGDGAGPGATPSAPTAAASTCPSCGAERIPAARFCPHCGCSFTGAARASATVPPVRVTGVVPATPAPPAGGRAKGTAGDGGEHGSPPLLAWASASDASRCDDVDVLLGIHGRGLARAVMLPRGMVDLPSDAALVDEPAALAAGRGGRARMRWRARSQAAEVDAPAALRAAAPRRRSLAADWADVAERPLPRKEHGSAELAAQRGRDLLLLATVADEAATEPAPEPEVAYEPAAPATVANPAPWAAFAGSPGAPGEKK